MKPTTRRHLMKSKTLRRSGAVSLLGLSLLGALSASCEQPDLLCDVASGPYVTLYFPKNPAEDCLMLPGELIGMANYNPPASDGETLDVTKSVVAVQPSSLGDLSDSARNAAGAVDPAEDHTLFSFGDYSNKPAEDGFCSASNLTAAEQHIPETAYTDGDGNAQVFPETRLSYEWTDLKVYMTFATPGNVATGEVTITKEVTDPTTGTKDACSATYVASALFPAVGCEGADAMGKPTGMPDDTKCCATADLESDRSFGSGIHPEFKVKCDPALLLCVLDWKPGEAFPPRGGNAFCE
jgi:hypothetical protein